MKPFFAILGILVIAGCSPVPSVSAPGADAPGAAPTTLPAWDAPAAAIPAGWATHKGEQCEYAISYPPEMQVTDQNAYSQLINFPVADQDAGARNFIYVSVVTPEIQEKVSAGNYLADVYNYDPAATDTLLSMQVGESESAHPAPAMESGFTYQRQPDATLGGFTVMTYENAQPWEFPPGTKEIRNYASLNGCTYLVGGYVDTTGSDMPGAINEDLFQQIMGTVQLTP
jgi:hypothetical protein